MNDKEQFESVGGGLLVRAPAKINLSLLVVRQRSDGFHELETIMAKINWYDEILIEPGQKAGIELVCKGPHWAPTGKENLVYRAAELLLHNCGLKTDVKITLIKNIPAGSGLGSASSDAASGYFSSLANLASSCSSSGNSCRPAAFMIRNLASAPRKKR